MTANFRKRVGQMRGHRPRLQRKVGSSYVASRADWRLQRFVSGLIAVCASPLLPFEYPDWIAEAEARRFRQTPSPDCST